MDIQTQSGTTINLVYQEESNHWKFSKDGKTLLNLKQPDFYNSDDIEEVNVVIPEGIEIIGEDIFDEWDDEIFIGKLSIPSSVKVLTPETISLARQIEVNEKNLMYSSIEGALYNKSKTELLCMPTEPPEHYEMPNSLVNIHSGALDYCIFKTLKLSPNLKFQDDLWWSVHIGQIVLNGNPNYKFYKDCLYDREGKRLLCVTNKSFKRTEIELLDSTEYIDALVLPPIQFLYIPHQLKTIKNIHAIDASKIEASPFNPYYSSIDGVLFNNDKSIILRYPSLCNRTEYKIPNGVIACDGAVFNHAKNLKRIIIPESIEEFEGTYQTESLECVEFRGLVKRLLNDHDYNEYEMDAYPIFDDTDCLQEIKIPIGATSYYKGLFQKYCPDHYGEYVRLLRESVVGANEPARTCKCGCSGIPAEALYCPDCGKRL